MQVKKSYWFKAIVDIAKLLSDDLYITTTQFKNKDKILNSIVYILLNNIRIILSFNLESYREKIRLCNLIFRKIGCLGILFI